jgi:flagellar L-ring protein precursor FlgH
MNAPVRRVAARRVGRFGPTGLLVLPLVALLAGCSGQRLETVGREPPLSPVGTGLASAYSPTAVDLGGQAERPRRYNSLWSRSGGELFSDSRASRPGDVVTVNVTMDDKASLANSTDRSRKSNSSLGGSFDFGFQKSSATGNANAQANGSTSTQGQGTVDRSERIGVSVATVVSRVLPNGNLLISGSQEVRVNSELRVLNISGIVRPNDISADNTITYEKIAEARISYGGNGRLSEVQQPGYGQQLYDSIAPF